MKAYESSQPLISIIVPCYNVEEYLSKCLDSLIRQTYTNIEIICVNDGSKDRTLEIMESYAAQEERIQIIDQKNAGISGARNAGIEKAKGQYIMFVDSDDWVDKNICLTLYNSLIDNTADISFCSYIREFEHRSIPKNIFQEDIVFDNEGCRYLQRRILGLNGVDLANPENADAIVTVWGKLYKASLIKDTKTVFIDTKIIGTEDALFNLYVFKYIDRAVFCNMHLYHYRKNNCSVTNKYKETLFEQWKRLFDLMDSYITENNLDQEYKQALSNRVAMSILGLGINICLSERGHKWRIGKIKQFLSDARYKNAYKSLSLRYIPIHWKMFYVLAKLNFASGVYTMLIVIRKMIGKWK